MKRIVIALVSLAFIGCGSSDNSIEKTDESTISIAEQPNAEQLEKESLNSGITSDSLNLGFYFGMTREKFDENISTLLSKNQITLTEDSSVISIMATENFHLHSNSIYSFEDGRLYRCITHTYPDQSKKISTNNISIGAELIALLEKSFGSTKHTNGTQASKYFWLKGNKRIDYYDTLDRYIVAWSDMRVERIIEENNQKEKEANLRKQQEEEQRTFTKLKERAKRDWPDDYTTQEFWLNEQREAYDYMKNIPDDDIKRKAQRDWPLDFSTQKFWYNEQIAARERLNR